MSVGTSAYGTPNNTAPIGLKIICYFGIASTILGFLFTVFIGIWAGEAGAAAVLIIAALIFSLLHIILLYGLLKLNRTAYIIYMAFTAIAILLAIFSLQIISIAINGLVFGYLLTINDRF